ncbi:hypothetical protein [Dyadobacter sediminis]|uniref:hypothetical protein n=1 Tax=Dyadobacter sediminis TaxID=1493691 RepID=UPI001486144F|nr:hypothetical protein [Dyadobacter sediminis]GGB81344.1 hypothetical protein GCM10011325_06010 [Dyadobacter sediminis]
MKITVLLLLAVTSINTGNTTQQLAETSADDQMNKEIAASGITKDYEKHPAFAVIRNCN